MGRRVLEGVSKGRVSGGNIRRHREHHLPGSGCECGVCTFLCRTGRVSCALLRFIVLPTEQGLVMTPLLKQLCVCI